MNQFTHIIDTYLTNYNKYKDGKIVFNCDYGELIFLKKDINTLTLSGIYIESKYRQQGLCRDILHYIIDNTEKQFTYLCIESVISKILYNYLVKFIYNNKKFKNSKNGFIYKLKK